MGLNYVDSIIVYNEYKTRRDGTYYFGTRFDNVRIELTKGEVISKTGSADASSCVAKIDKNFLPIGKAYKDCSEWAKLPNEEKLLFFTFNEGKDFFVVVKSKSLNIDIDMPVGMVSNSKPEFEDEGFFSYTKGICSHSYIIGKIDDYDSVPTVRHYALHGE